MNASAITQAVAAVHIVGSEQIDEADRAIADLEKLIQEKSAHRLTTLDGRDLTEQAMRPYHDMLAAMRAARTNATA